MPPTPDPDKVHHYPLGRQPYVEVRKGEFLLHAKVLSWTSGQVYIEYPIRTIGVANSPRTREWVPTSSAKRIRRTDAIFADPGDDMPWHKEQDPKIKHRADPWTVYLQEMPEPPAS